MIKVTKANLTVRKRVVIPINLSLRVSGAFYSVYGGIAFVKLLQVMTTGHGSTMNLIACAILAAFTLFGFVLCLSIESLTFDPTALNYEYRKGIWPFVNSTSGQVGDIKAISVERFVQSQTEGEENSPSASISVRIEWNGDQKPLVLAESPEESLFGGNRDKIIAKARRFSDALHVPLIDRT